MKVINSAEFDLYWKDSFTRSAVSESNVEKTVSEIIAEIRFKGDEALRHYSLKFDKRCPDNFEINISEIRNAVKNLEKNDPELSAALRFAAQNIKRFSLAQKEQFRDFEYENVPGVYTGQKVIPVSRAAVYVPGGRFPLMSTALMSLIPAFCAGVKEVCFVSPPSVTGEGAVIPDSRILAAAGIAAEICGRLENSSSSQSSSAQSFRIFCAGGAQAVAAFALGTETIPRCDLIAGPGNKYVVEAKRMLFGETGIDLLPGPSDILVICDENFDPDLAAADMLAQAEHDPDARSRALVPSREAADLLNTAIKKRLNSSSGMETAKASLDNGGLIVIYSTVDEAVSIANNIAPEHLEIHASHPDAFTPLLKNYGSLFIGKLAAEVLGDYSSGINHTLPTKCGSRFSGGLSVRHFLKTLTTLRCESTDGYREVLQSAETIGKAEGLFFHAESAKIRQY